MIQRVLKVTQIEDHDCQMCGNQAEKIHKVLDNPLRAVFICNSCSENYIDYVLDSLDPTLVLTDKQKEKVRNRIHQKKYRYLKKHNPNLPPCQCCYRTENTRNVLAKPIKSPWLVYRFCPSCEKKANREDYQPIDIRDYT